MTHNGVQQYAPLQQYAILTPVQSYAPIPSQSSIAKEHLILLDMRDRIPDMVESFYNNDERILLNSRLKPLSWASVVDNVDVSLAINYITNHEQGAKYNACQMTKSLKLSKNNRVCLGDSFDAFQGLEIPCVNPETDIESVTLSIGIPIPTQAELSRMASDENGLGSERFNYLFYSASGQDKDNAKILYFPLKKLTGLKSRYVSFYDCPVLLNTDNSNLTYSVEVKYTASHLAPQGHQVVQLHYLKFKEYMRTNIRLCHNVFYQRKEVN
jgi:hypothetical protein